jgi:hypothetical protein
VEAELAHFSASVIRGEVLGQSSGCVEETRTLSTYHLWMHCVQMFRQLGKLSELLVAVFAAPRFRAMNVVDVPPHIASVCELSCQADTSVCH